MARILVTGGCGFIGANLVPRLERAGYVVSVLDNLTRGSRAYLQDTNAAIFEGDIRDPKACEAAMANADKVIHLAAYGSVVESVDQPLENFDVNAHGTLCLLEAAARAEVTRFVFASTGGALIGDADPPVEAKTSRREQRPAAQVALRREQARGRGLLPCLCRLARAGDRDAALRQCLWAGERAQERRGHRV